jgi:hypothetical protein
LRANGHDAADTILIEENEYEDISSPFLDQSKNQASVPKLGLEDVYSYSASKIRNDKMVSLSKQLSRVQSLGNMSAKSTSMKSVDTNGRQT